MLHPRFTRDDIIKRVDEILATCGIADEAVLRRSVDALSSGQQQILASCIAFAPKPEIVLMDEPFARLDIEASERLSRLILSAAHDTIIVIATHDTASSSDDLRRNVASIVTVARSGSDLTLCQGTYAPEQAVATFATDILEPLKKLVTYGASDGAPSPLMRRRIRVIGGTDDAVLESKNLELKIKERLITLLVNLKVTKGVNVVEGSNGTGKTFFGQFIAGYVPLNPLIRWSDRYATGAVELPTHRHASLSSIRKRGMSVFLPATPDLWLPERAVSEELNEFHPDGLDSTERQILDHAGIDLSARLSQLSYGQKRLLALVALPRQLELVFIDEPFADLSVSSARLVLDLVMNRTKAETWQAVMLSLAQPEGRLGAQS